MSSYLPQSLFGLLQEETNVFNAVAPSPLHDVRSCDRRDRRAIRCSGTGIMNKSTAMSVNLTYPCNEGLVKLRFSVPELDAVLSYT